MNSLLRRWLTSPTGLQYTADLGLRDIRDPWFRDRTKTYDLIR